MARQQFVPELHESEWEAWIAHPQGHLKCPVQGCEETSLAYWNGVDETLTITGCGHSVFIPEAGPITWPPPEESHVRRRLGGWAPPP